MQIVLLLCSGLVLSCLASVYSNERVQVYMGYGDAGGGGEEYELVESPSDGDVFVATNLPNFRDYLGRRSGFKRSTGLIRTKYIEFAMKQGDYLAKLRHNFWRFCLNKEDVEGERMEKFNKCICDDIENLLDKEMECWAEKDRWHKDYLRHIITKYLWPRVQVFYEFKDRPRWGIKFDGKHGWRFAALRLKLMSIDDKVKSRIKKEFRVSAPFGLSSRYILSLRFTQHPEMGNQAAEEIKRKIFDAVSSPFNFGSIAALDGRLIKNYSWFIVDRVGLLKLSSRNKIEGIAETEEVHKCKGDNVWVLSVMKIFEWVRWMLIQRGEYQRSAFVINSQWNHLPLELAEYGAKSANVRPRNALIPKHTFNIEFSSDTIKRAKELFTLVSIPIERLFNWYSAATPNFPDTFIDSVVLMVLHSYSKIALITFLKEQQAFEHKLDKQARKLHGRLMDELKSHDESE